jgi:hypothetical protein
LFFLFILTATAILDENRYLAWSKSYKAALTDHTEVEKRRSGGSGVMNDIDILEDYIEKDMELLGVTGTRCVLKGLFLLITQLLLLEFENSVKHKQLLTVQSLLLVSV